MFKLAGALYARYIYTTIALSQSAFERLMDHYRRPRNYGAMMDADVSARDTNVLCGDVIEIFIKVKNNVILNASFIGEGCMLSQASASILTELIKGMNIEDVMKITKKDFIKILGVDLGPVRSKCATLPLNALKKAIKEFKERSS